MQTVTLASTVSGKEPSVGELCSRLNQTLVEFKPQAVFLPGWSCAASFIAHSWCRSNAVPAVVMSESNSWDDTRSFWKERVKQRLAKMYSSALVGGTTHKQYLVELGMNADQIFLGYDAVDNDYFASKAAEVRGRRTSVENAEMLKPETLKSEISGPRSPSSGLWPPSSPFFLASARFVEKKNLLRLIEAYARYRKMAQSSEVRSPSSLVSGPSSLVSGPSSVVSSPSSVVSSPQSVVRSPSSVVPRHPSRPWDLVLLGDGPLRSSILDLRSSLGLGDSVHLPGFKQYDELPEFYALAKVFIHASTTEQWGLVVNEAMASGLPVLVSNRCGCAQDLVHNGVNGFTFDPADVEQMAQLMFQLSAFQPFRLSEFGSASQRIISDWGTRQFAQGVLAAAKRASMVGASRSSIGDKLFLRLLAAMR